MEFDRKLLLDVKKLMIARYPRFGAEIAAANLEYKTDLQYHTAATDGKNIYFDPNYLASLSNDDKLFIIAHELMHVKFEHMFRIVDKEGKMRDPEIWNIATDAIINANLERDGFKIKDGYVNMPEALNYNAEEFYEKLLKEKKQQQNQQNQAQGSNQNGNQQGSEQRGQENSQNGDQQGQENNHNGDQQGQENAQKGSGSEQFGDDHSLWEKAFEESQQSGNVQKQNSNKNQDTSSSEQSKRTSSSEQSKDTKLNPNANLPEFDNSKTDERANFAENREMRREIARQQFEKMKDQGLKKTESGIIHFGEVGEAKPILDWKLLLRREVEKTETIWSQRRSIAENNYAYRLEENEIEDQAETEVMIDVSGSVSLNMVRAFLRQLKPLLKESKLKVGCFNERFWGMVEIKSNKDIDNFKIPSAARGDSAWTQDWDLAVRSFSKKREVNKIVFTDGEDWGGTNGTWPKNDLKGTNVIWLIYKNRECKPCCGKIINIYPKDLKNMANAICHEEAPELSF